MTGRLGRFALVAIVPTLVDIGLLVLLRRGLGWILVVADLASIAAASAVSYGLHRAITFRSDPYVRWVRMPLAFVVIASLAALVDVAVLRLTFAGTGFDSTASLVAAKVVALGAAAVVRVISYRVVLVRAVRRSGGAPGAPPPRGAGPDVSVVIPAYEEEEGIGSTIGRLRAAGAARDVELEIVVVDDGSADATSDVALRAGADQVITQARNAGKGAAVRAGMLVARGRIAAFTDADLAYDPDVVLSTALRVDEGWDAVVGDRRHPDAGGAVGSTWIRSIGSQGINFLTYAVLLGSYRDTQCGLKAFRRDVARDVFARARLDGFAFDIEVLHLLERDERSLATVPVVARHSDRSTVNLAADSWQLLGDLMRVRHWSAVGDYERRQ